MKLEAIVDSTVYDLSDVAEFLLQGEEDFGMAPVRRLSEAGPLQNGATDIGFRLEPRKLRVKLATNSDDTLELYARRAKLLSIFKPRTTAIQLLKTLDDGAKRQIDCFFSAGLGFRSSDRQGMVQVEVVELIAPDPTFYDPTTVAVSFGLDGGSGEFAIPLAIPWAVGASSINQTLDVTYGGTWMTEPIVTIYGPISDAVILNETIGVKLDLTGATIDAGEWVTIDTRYGRKSVTSSLSGNRIADLTEDSDLATFRLEAAPDAHSGINTLRVTGNGLTEATQVYLSYYTRYVGV